MALPPAAPASVDIVWASSGGSRRIASVQTAKPMVSRPESANAMVANGSAIESMSGSIAAIGEFSGVQSTCGHQL